MSSRDGKEKNKIKDNFIILGKKIKGYFSSPPFKKRKVVFLVAASCSCAWMLLWRWDGMPPFGVVVGIIIYCQDLKGRDSFPSLCLQLLSIDCMIPAVSTPKPYELTLHVTAPLSQSQPLQPPFISPYTSEHPSLSP